ncbi:DUF294 nucleotidyltransferase-like domain-containing protein [Rhodovibrionaceae bacterium A322]
MSFSKAERSLSGLPLGALPAIALDTETTGLDVTEDRIIEIAAVCLDEKSPDAESERQAPPSEYRALSDPEGRRREFSQLVNPGLPIPPASTEIHNITDDMVKDATGFPAVMAAFASWAETRVVIGYAIGFDLAVLKAEHERHGVKWTAPRAIDLRHLIQLVAPNLPNQSLETAASWLGVEIQDRHRALGDAKAAAGIFQALVPKLREKGILTLAQAERLTRNLTTRLEMEVRAGWHEVGNQSSSLPAGVAEFARIDSFPYRHRVADIMHHPAIAVAGDLSMKEALALMVDKAISSVFVQSGRVKGEAKSHAILTERDVLRAVNADADQALTSPVSRYAKGPLVTVDSHEFVYRAIANMAVHGFRHLGVRGPDGSLVGALSARDLLHQRASDALSLGSCIEKAETDKELGRIWSDLTTVAQSLLYEEADPRDIAAIISRELCSLTKRAGQLAEQDMQAEGRGPAPQRYALLVLGSGGRGESLLAMDQDNAIIFENGNTGSEVDQWFESLGQKIADKLNSAGVVYCKGGIMASNAAWRKDLPRWQAQVQGWISKARPEDMLNGDIFFDAQLVHGDQELADSLTDDARRLARGSKDFLKAMAVNTSEFRMPLNWLGRPRLKDGRIDLKMNGILPIISAARIASLTFGLRVRSTPERLEGLRDKNLVDPSLIDNLLQAHKIMLGAILQQQLRDLEAGLTQSNKVAPGEMDAHARQDLTWALHRVGDAHSLLGTQPG